MIYWILSYMNAGRASTFAQRIMGTETRTRKPVFTSFAEFLQEFELEFCEDETTDALMRLESDQYYQGTWALEEYMDKFRYLIDISGLSDPYGIILKFRRGLDPDIQNRIAESESHPDLSNTNGWYKMAKHIYLNLVMNQAFNATSHKPMMQRTPIPTATPTQRKPPQAAPLTPAPQCISVITRTCTRCKATGHLHADCPQQFDIRSMTLPEKDQMLDKLLTERNKKPRNPAKFPLSRIPLWERHLPRTYSLPEAPLKRLPVIDVQVQQAEKGPWHTMDTLVNAEVDGHLIDSDHTRKIGLQTRTLMRPLSLTSGKNSDTSIVITEVAEIRLRFGGHTERTHLALAKLNGPDLVLGRDWFSRHAPKVDPQTRTFAMTQKVVRPRCYKCVPLEWKLLPPMPTSLRDRILATPTVDPPVFPSPPPSTPMLGTPAQPTQSATSPKPLT